MVATANTASAIRTAPARTASEAHGAARHRAARRNTFCMLISSRDSAAAQANPARGLCLYAFRRTGGPDTRPWPRVRRKETARGQTTLADHEEIPPRRLSPNASPNPQPWAPPAARMDSRMARGDTMDATDRCQTRTRPDIYRFMTRIQHLMIGAGAPSRARPAMSILSFLPRAAAPDSASLRV